jgi:hypothetical protein
MAREKEKGGWGNAGGNGGGVLSRGMVGETEEGGGGQAATNGVGTSDRQAAMSWSRRAHVAQAVVR